MDRMDEKKSPGDETTTRFLRRRDQWIRWVLESDLSLVARVVGTHLAMRMNVRDQAAWPNVKTMARLLEVSPRHVSRAIAELDAWGALWVFRDRGRGNRYRLKLPTDPPSNNP